MRIETILFEASDWVPNNPELPVVLYCQAIADRADLATAFEERFARLGGLLAQRGFSLPALPHRRA